MHPNTQRPARSQVLMKTMETETPHTSKALPDSISDFRTLANEIIAHAQLSTRPNTAPTAAPDPTPDAQLADEAGKLLAHLHPEEPLVHPGSVEDRDMWQIADPTPSHQFACLLQGQDAAFVQATQAESSDRNSKFVQHAETQAPAQPPQNKPMMQVLYVQVGPFEVRPSVGRELPIGRNYQQLPVSSISRLAGYVGRDDYGLYIREVPEMPEYGLQPSRNGIWVKQPADEYFRRLAPGEAERVTKDSVVRLGGNGADPDKGYPVVIV